MKMILRGLGKPKCWLSGLLLLAALSPGTAKAQASPPSPTPTTLTTTGGTPTGATDDNTGGSTAREDPDAVFRAFNVYARQQSAYHLTTALGGLVLSGTTMGLGAIIADKTGTSNTPWLIVGGVTAGLSLLALLAPDPGEQLAKEMRTDESGHTHEQARLMEKKWKALAERARTERIVNSIVGLAIGAGALGTGIAFMAGAGNLSNDDEALVGGLLIGSGSAIVVGSTANFFVKRPEETSFAQYEATTASSASVALSMGAGPSGFLLGASGTF